MPIAVRYRQWTHGAAQNRCPGNSPGGHPVVDETIVYREGKIVTCPEAVSLVRTAQRGGEVVVLCHGCFDIVHPGHVRHLQQAARLGNRLLVTITGDSMVDKDTGRPLIPQELRAENLAALDCVDWVAVNPAPTASDMLRQIRPDVYVKGREYELNHDPRFQDEKNVVEGYGGRVVFTSGDVVFSSTALIEALESSANPFQARIRQLVERRLLEPGDLETAVESFHGRRVLVVGETIVDTYVMCDRPDIAGEGPMMSLRPLEYRRFDGGAAIIARHLAAMGARPILVTALPGTADAEALRHRLTDQGISVHWIDVDCPLAEKQRFLVGTAKVMKLDLCEPITLDAARRRELLEMAADQARTCDAAIVADYGLGMLTSATLTELCRRLRTHVRVLVGDVSGRRSNLLAMRDVDLLCPSEVELRDALHNYGEGLSAVTCQLLNTTGCRAALVTLGDQGLIAFESGAGGAAPPDDWSTRLQAEHVPAMLSHAVDALGCGDALLAAATLTLAGGAGSEPPLLLAGVLGSLAAAAQTQKLGNAVIGAADLRRGMRRVTDARLTCEAEPSSIITTRSHDQLDQLSTANA